MKRLLLALACLALSLPVLAQNADDPASRDDVILYLRTMHSHDLMQKTMEVELQSMHQLMHEQILKEKGKVPANFEAQFKKMMDELLKNMPMDEMEQAMVPAYRKHFTHGDIEAMNAFYSSPVGQKVLQELPAVMQEGLQTAMPILSKYLSEAEERMKRELAPEEKSSPANSESGSPPTQN